MSSVGLRFFLLTFDNNDPRRRLESRLIRFRTHTMLNMSQDSRTRCTEPHVCRDGKLNPLLVTCSSLSPAQSNKLISQYQKLKAELQTLKGAYLMAQEKVIPTLPETPTARDSMHPGSPMQNARTLLSPPHRLACACASPLVSLPMRHLSCSVHWSVPQCCCLKCLVATRGPQDQKRASANWISSLMVGFPFR